MSTTDFFYSCACTAMDGKLKLFNRELMEKALFHAPNGADLELIIQERGRQRTSQQNRFFHGPIIDAFESLGWDRADAKTELCLKYLPHEHVRPDGSIVIVPGHTSALNVKDFNRLIESCIQLAAEMGVVVQDGDQWLAAHRHKSEAA